MRYLDLVLIGAELAGVLQATLTKIDDGRITPTQAVGDMRWALGQYRAAQDAYSTSRDGSGPFAQVASV